MVHIHPNLEGYVSFYGTYKQVVAHIKNRNEDTFIHFDSNHGIDNRSSSRPHFGD